ncbi:MAG: glycosyltransferase [Burkholderiaceae bacterium]
MNASPAQPTAPALSSSHDPADGIARSTICLSIVSHGQRDVALALLHDLARLKPPHVARIVYTRNIAEPPLPDLDLGNAVLIQIDNIAPKGFSANHNAAFPHCREAYFCVMNPDLRLDDDPFPALLAGFDSGSMDTDATATAKTSAPANLIIAKPRCGNRMGLVAPVIVDSRGALQNTARTLYTPIEMIRQKLHPSNEGSRADWLAGMFMLFRSEAYASIGGFDERYFLYIEDVDICSRLVADGWCLRQVPTARVVHDARKTSHRSLRYTLWHLDGMLRYWRGKSYRDYRRILRERHARHA